MWCMVGGCGAWWVGVVHGGWVWCMVGGCGAWWVGVMHGGWVWCMVRSPTSTQKSGRLGDIIIPGFVPLQEFCSPISLQHLSVRCVVHGGCGSCGCVVLCGQTPFCTEGKGQGHGHRAVW